MEFYNQLFEPATDRPSQWAYHDFEECTFKNLDLSKAVLAGANFINCHFESCNLTQAILASTRLDDAVFVNCKLNSVDFGPCSTLGFHVDFQECQLNYAIFLNRNLKKTRFADCSLKEARFMKCDLSGAIFKNCDLELALFADNTLTQTDFSSSYHLGLDPENNKLKKTKLSLYNLPGLLTKYDIVIK